MAQMKMEISDPGIKVVYAFLRGKDGGDCFRRWIGFVKCVEPLLAYSFCVCKLYCFIVGIMSLEYMIPEYASIALNWNS